MNCWVQDVDLSLLYKLQMNSTKTWISREPFELTIQAPNELDEFCFSNLWYVYENGADFHHFSNWRIKKFKIAIRVRERRRFFISDKIWHSTIATRVRERRRFLKTNKLWHFTLATRVRERRRFFTFQNHRNTFDPGKTCTNEIVQRLGATFVLRTPMLPRLCRRHKNGRTGSQDMTSAQKPSVLPDDHRAFWSVVSCRDVSWSWRGRWAWIPGGGLRRAPFYTPNLR